MSNRIRVSSLFFALLCWSAADVGPAQAFSGGIASTALGSSGCNQCHSGGLVETVKLAGPAYVDPGTTVEYQLSLIVRGTQDHGGLNAAASDGVLSTGGEFESETKVITGAGGRDEITHSSTKVADIWDQVEFTFHWTAPDEFSSVTLDVWGNGVDNSGDATGDQASFISLEIRPLSEQPTGPICVADLLPPSPLPVTDRDQQKCQAAVAKTGLSYVSGVLKSVQKCLQDFHRWGLTGIHTDVCVGSTEVPPTDFATAQKVAKSEAKALAFVDKSCTDETIAPLDLCADTVSGFKTCFVESYRPLIGELVSREFGVVKQTDDKALRKCQKAISKEAGKFATTSLKTMLKCASAMNDGAGTQDTAATCMGSVADGTYVQPTDAKATRAISKAEGKLASKLSAACTDAQLAALDSCGNDTDSLAECLMCTHRAVTYEAMEAGYGGAEVVAEP